MIQLQASARLVRAASTHSNDAQPEAVSDTTLTNNCKPQSKLEAPGAAEGGATHTTAAAKPAFKLQAAMRIKASDDEDELKELTDQIKQVEEDIRETEEEGDDASFERKHLDRLRAARDKLKDKMGIQHASAVTAAASKLKQAATAAKLKHHVTDDIENVDFPTVKTSHGAGTPVVSFDGDTYMFDVFDENDEPLYGSFSAAHTAKQLGPIIDRTCKALKIKSEPYLEFVARL